MSSKKSKNQKRPTVKRILLTADESTSDTALYETIPANTDSIILQVIPGDSGQSSVTDVYLNNRIIMDGHLGRITNKDMGTNNNLRGKILDIYTAITDIVGAPDRTSFWMQLKGGIKIYENSMSKTVSVQGSTVVFHMTIIFF